MRWMLAAGVGVFCTAAWGQAAGQLLSCSAGAVPQTVRAEGVTERVGDISLSCTGGQPNGTITGNFTLFLNVDITNRIGANNATDIQFTYDIGAGPQASNVPGVLNGAVVSFDGVDFPLSATGTVGLRIFNIRGNATEVKTGGTIQATLAVNSGNILPLTQSSFVVAFTQTGLYSGATGSVVCSQKGSPLPASPLSFAALVGAHTSFATLRLTEGFASAFEPQSNQTNFNADSGERFVITYSGFPAGARLFVPTVVAGSDAFTPTAGGDMGLTASGGQYAPGGQGSLLLSLVTGADGTGAGGRPFYRPAPGSGMVILDAMTELILTNGSAVAVYEVVDANPFLQESAQIPAFLGLAPGAVGGTVQTALSETFGAVSAVSTASATAAVPRFEGVPPGPDCSLVGDCGAAYYPKLRVLPGSASFTTVAGGVKQGQYIQIQNAGGGVLQWAATVEYPAGEPTGWLSVNPGSGIGAASGFIYMDPSQLNAGTYTASVVVTLGVVPGQAVIPVTVTVSAPPAPPAPSIGGVTNAANFQLNSVVPGSLATIFGAHFTGTTVTASFAGAAAKILYQGDGQLNVVVPDSLTPQTAALVVTVDGRASEPAQVRVAASAPGIFAGGVLNQDSSVNEAGNPAGAGSVLQVYATGLGGTITAKINGEAAEVEYGGAAPGFIGVQQVNVVLPVGAGNGAQLQVCGAGICSAAVGVAVKGS